MVLLHPALFTAGPAELFIHSLADGDIPHAEDKAAGATEHPAGTWRWPVIA